VGRPPARGRRRAAGAPLPRRHADEGSTNPVPAHGRRYRQPVGAAGTLGISRSTLTGVRKRDLAFDQQVEQALKEGVQRLETALLNSALRGLHGEEEDDAGTRGEPVGGDPEPGWPELPALPPLTAAEAFALLRKQQELLSRPRKWSPGRDRQRLALATLRLEAALKRFQLLPAPGSPGPEEQPLDPSSPPLDPVPQIRRL
jgi:hypothetical protein